MSEVSEEVNTDTPEDIDAAKIQGWNENYDGENKKTAKEFLETGNSINAVLKDRLDKVSKDNQSINDELSKTRHAMEKLVNFQDEQKERAVKKAIAGLESKRDTAIDEGDRETVHKIDKEIEVHKEKPPENPVFDNWVSENKWYKSDPFLKIEADKVAEAYFSSGLEGNELFDAVKNHMKELYPSKFSNPNRKEPSAAESSSPAGNDKKRSFSDLPQDAKEAYEEFKEFMPDLTKKAWAEKYEWEE